MVRQLLLAVLLSLVLGSTPLATAYVGQVSSLRSSCRPNILQTPRAPSLGNTHGAPTSATVVVSGSSQSIVRTQCSLARRRARATQCFFFRDDRTDEEIEEEVRLDILKSRRNQIRAVLKSAEAVRNVRIAQGWVPPAVDEDGNPVDGATSNSGNTKLAVTLTAFCVAAGAIALRIGGRAALVSAVGLDFASDNPDLKNQLDQILAAADSMGDAQKLLLFTAAWTAVKLLLFDAGGVVLALSSGILFGGVLQGALASAGAATFGSAVAFGLAKLDTPVRRKALQVLDEYPSLRGIEKVVAKDGLKAILTLRLAPILPIPIGLYNYIYAVTGVPVLDFMGGIFLGSLKPYLLDSYLGYFGKEVVEGSADAAGLQDVLLLLALGLSVLIGVFASQLASETWDSVLAEVEAEKKAKLETGDEEGSECDDGVMRQFLGWTLPDFAVNVQTSYKEAEAVVQSMIDAEHRAQVWNFTEAEGGPPASRDPAHAPSSPEVTEVGKRFDFMESLYVGMALSPTLFGAWLKYANPMTDDRRGLDCGEQLPAAPSALADTNGAVAGGAEEKVELMKQIEALKAQANAKLNLAQERLRDSDGR